VVAVDPRKGIDKEPAKARVHELGMGTYQERLVTQTGQT